MHTARAYDEARARTGLAGANRLEILLFRLAPGGQSFGINVFKVREVLAAPLVTPAPDAPTGVTGVISLRGRLLPVVSLAGVIGVESGPEEILVVAEFNGQSLGLLAHAVDTIVRTDWGAMKPPPALASRGLEGRVTAVTELADGRLVMMLDVERILADLSGEPEAAMGGTATHAGKRVLYADDSAIARKQIARTLATLGVEAYECANGRLAWEALGRLADDARARGEPLARSLHAVLTDIEMPEMDGYVLTRAIKADPRFQGIPVLMHSSLSSQANTQMGRSVGADEYLAKFSQERLAETLRRVLDGNLGGTHGH